MSRRRPLPTRIGQYIHPQRDVPLPAGVEPPKPKGSPTPVVFEIAATTRERLRAHTTGTGATVGAVVERALELQTARMRELLGVAEFPPLPSSGRVLPSRHGGALKPGTALARIQLRPKRPELIEQGRRALWYVHQQRIDPARVGGITSLPELLSVGIETVLDDLDRAASPESPT